MPTEREALTLMRRWAVRMLPQLDGPPGWDCRCCGGVDSHREHCPIRVVDRALAPAPAPKHHPDCVAAMCGFVGCGREGPCYSRALERSQAGGP